MKAVPCFLLQIHNRERERERMDDGGFKDRVDKVFGSITSSSSSSWSVSDAQVQRREWRRHHHDESERERDDDRIPVSSSFFHQHDDEWDIRSSIGLDSTLDNEVPTPILSSLSIFLLINCLQEEEDSYDKMAEGRENDREQDRLYMKDVTHHALYLNFHNVLPTSLLDVRKDPRANHDAAKTRLKQDDDFALHQPMSTAQASLKSILKKRKTYDADEASASTPTAKRVSFHSTCKNADAHGYAPTPQATRNKPTAVPDYILNPSSYTRYTFHDPSHLENSSKHDAMEHKSSAELPKSLVFIPRKKKGDDDAEKQVNNKQSSTQPCSTVAIAAQQGEINEMQQDDDVCTKAMSQKPVRQYRSKMEEYDDAS